MVQIVIESLFQWDIKAQKAKGPGVLGTLLAYAPADEEQGRKTLHMHMQIWVKEVDQKLRDDLFHENQELQQIARKKFYSYIDKVMSASYGGDLVITHRCGGLQGSICGSTCERDEGCFVENSDQILRNARSKEQAKTLQGHILKCHICETPISTIDVVNLSLMRWKLHTINNARMTGRDRSDLFIPLTGERLDVAAMTYSYHSVQGCQKIDDPFWSDPIIRKVLLTLRFDEHEYTHWSSCFKKGCECRFFFPFGMCDSTMIYEDRGFKDANVEFWHRLDGTVKELAPWLVLPKRPMGCQFVNVHNDAIAEVLNCNTNIQVGDASQIYYTTLYNCKSTQEEDGERQRRVGHTICRRLLRIQEEIQAGVQNPDTDADNFVEGLCRLLGGMNAATSRDVISATMAHLLVCRGGTRFKFSHDFGPLLISQLEATLEGENVDRRIRINKLKGKTIAWPDSSADDYIYRPTIDSFEQICSYEFTMLYKKRFKTFKQMSDMEKGMNDCIDGNDADDCDIDEGIGDGSGVHHYTNLKYSFSKSHPGYSFSHLAQLKLPVIPKVYLPKGKLCRVEDLEIRSTSSSEEAQVAREDYAKVALLMFYPFRMLDDITQDGSYWKLFCSELELFYSDKPTRFWKNGFGILQNIQDRVTLEKNYVVPRILSH